MSCPFSKKFEPLVESWAEAFKYNQITSEEALQKVIDAFGEKDGQIIFKAYFEKNGVGISDSVFSEYEQVSEKIRQLEGEVPEDIISTRSNFVGNFSGYAKMVSDFKARIIESSVYNKRTEKFVNAEKEFKNGISELNKNLFDYKLELINDLLADLNRSKISIDILSDSAAMDLTNYISLVISAYEASISTGNLEHWQSYVILKNFNKLLKEQTPFIVVKDSYKNSNVHGINMYSYDGPRAQLRTTYSKEDDIPSAEAQYSKLAKILLSYLPEVASDLVTDIENTSIESSGFASIMSTMRSAILYSSDPALSSLREEYMKGAEADMVKMIDVYLGYLSENEGFSKPYFSFLANKLRGIRKYIYASGMQEDVKNMFTRMFYETVPLQYLQYGYYNGELRGATIAERWVNNQNYRIQGTLNGRVETFRSNTNSWSVVKNRYNIQFEQGSNSIRGGFTMNVELDKRVVTLTFSYDVSNNNLSIKPSENTKLFENIDILTDLIYDITGYLVTPEYISYMKTKYGKNNYLLDDFAASIGIVIMASDIKNSNNPIAQNCINNNTVNFNKLNLYNNLRNISEIDSLVKGSETNNTVHDINGNNLPTRGIVSLAYQLRELHYEYEQVPQGLSPAHSNLVYLNMDLLSEPIIREGVVLYGKGKKARQLSEPELYECAIAYDFFEHLYGDGIIHLQNDVFADKGKHFVWGWNLNHGIKTSTGEFFDLQNALKNINSTNTEIIKLARKQLVDFYKTTRNNRYAVIEMNIVDKYNKAFRNNRGDIKFKTLREVDNWLAEEKKTYADIKAAFENNIKIGEFIDEQDAIEIGKTGDKITYARINETLLNMIDTFNSQDTTRAELRIERSKRNFLKDLIDSGFILNRFSSKGGRSVYTRLLGSNPEWVDTTSGNVILGKVRLGNEVIQIGADNSELLVNPNYTVELNPILESYLFADVILSDELSSFMVGETFAHKMKGGSGDPNKIDFDESEYEEFSEATRLIAKIKRNVIPGASMHTMLQGMKNGVAKRIKIAIMDDIPGHVWNMFGISGKVPSSDGGGVSNIYEAMAERNSLIDAAAGLDMKTIGWDVDGKTFVPKMLKWAVYATTNNRRRDNIDSDASWEELHRKMNSEQIGFVDVAHFFNKSKDADNFYFFNNETGEYYKIISIESIQINGKTYFYKVANRTDKNGELVGETVFLNRDGNEIKVSEGNTFIINDAEKEFGLNSIYDLDIFFGGAYNKKKIDGKLRWGDLNNQITFDIICSKRLKNKMTAYMVNKSAFKVGYGNVNPTEAWGDRNVKLKTITMSTRHIGLQMNAEHDLIDSEVTEMTQMISALSENWYMGDLVKQIYKDIGAVVEESLRSINKEVAAEDMDALRVRLGKALIDAFKTKDETIGLAQAFLAKAETAMAESKAKVKIPFSAATINPTFISTITSNLNKKGIRRKYAGIAAVLTPSYNMTQYYRYDGKTTLHSGVSETIRNWKKEHPEFGKTNIRSFIHNLKLIDDFGNEVFNPFSEKIVNQNDLRQEDTLYILRDRQTEWEKVKLNSWENYNTWVNKPWAPNTIVRRMKLAPRDLMGADTFFTVADNESSENEKEFSIYNLMSVQASHGDINAYTATISDVYWKDDIIVNDDGSVNVKQTLKNIVQHQLDDLQNKGYIRDARFGKENIKVTNVNVTAAEIIMGRLNAEKFGLEEGDQVDDILKQGWNFFYNRWNNKYGELIDVPEDLYDVVLYTKTGPVLVKIGTDPDSRLTRNRDIEIVDDEYILNDSVLCSAEGKKKFSYISDKNNEYKVIYTTLENIDDLLESDAVDTYKYNVTWHNVSKIGKIVDPDGTKYGVKGDHLLTVGKMDSALEEDFKQRQIKLAQQRFAAFEQSLNLVGARIPTQAMQSYMPLRVIAFTDDLTNVVYVPRMQTWLQGSDYDIDKLYILAHSIAENGTLPTLSGLTNIFEPQETLRLPAPDGRYFREGKGGYKVSLAELEQVTGMLGNAKIGEDALFDPAQLIPISKYKLEVFRKILKNPNTTTISFEEPLASPIMIPVTGRGAKEFKELSEDINWNQNLTYEDAKKRFIKLLKKHSRSKGRLNREMALRNNVAFGIFTASTAPVNQVNAHAPVEMDEADETSKKTAMSRMEKHVSSDIPSTKFKIQVQAGAGKDVTGISAVSVKVFFAETTYFNETLEDIIVNMRSTGSEQFALDLLDKLVTGNPLYKYQDENGNWHNQPTLVANVNVQRIINRLTKTNKQGKQVPFTHIDAVVPENSLLARWNTTNGFAIKDCLEFLKKQTSLVDAALSESGLLSASTDNMKHLYLPKLNATADFVDMYTTMLAHGTRFEDIAKVLTSPLFTAASKLTKYNIFRNETNGYSTERALGFYLNEDTLPHVNKLLLMKVFAAVGINITNASDVFNILAYNNPLNYGTSYETRDLQIKKVLNYLYDARENKFNSVDDEFFEDYYSGYGDAWVDEYDDGVNLENTNIEGFNVLINYLEQCIKRNEYIRSLDEKYKLPEYAQYGDAKTQLANLKIVKDEIIPKKEEQTTFGQMLGINGGIRTDAYHVYSMIRRIENFINKRISESNKQGKTSINEEFNLYDFLNPNKDFDEYREKWKEYYDSIKSSFNILRAITRVPHFKTMFDVLFTNNWILSKFSAKYEIVNAVAKEVERRNPYRPGNYYDKILSEKEYKQVVNYINDMFIMGWLSKQDIKFIVPAGHVKYDISSSDKLEGTTPVIMKNQYDFATFKNWMENYMIPELQKSERFGKYRFIRSLEFVCDQNRATGRKETYDRLPINMMTIDDSVKTQSLYDLYLRSFHAIQYEIPSADSDLKLADLFFLYNLIVNKDGYGQHSLTRIFENLVSTEHSTGFIESFYDYISDIDSNVENRKTMIDAIINTGVIQDVESWIAINVKSSNIKGNPISVLSLGSDYTFGAPELLKKWDVVKEKVFPFKTTTQKLFSQKLDSGTVRAGILSHLKTVLGEDKIKILNGKTIESLFPEDKLAQTASAFIHNGILYVRNDSKNATTATVHEMVHFLLAGMRFSDDANIRQFYYNMISKVTEDMARETLGDDIVDMYSEQRFGIDLQEEFFVKIIEGYFGKNILPKIEQQKEILASTEKFVSAFNELFATALTKEQFFTIMQNPSEDMFQAFATNIFSVDWLTDLSNSVIWSQKIADLKVRLKRENKIKETEC